MKSSFPRLLVALLLAAVHALGHASEIGPTSLPPKTYASPSGLVTLSVNPSERSGAGPAQYTLKRGAAVVWSETRPFTVVDAVVTDDGTAAGYGYSEGYRADSGDFVVAIFGPVGETRRVEATPRKHSGFLHTEADPKANGIFINSRTDRLVVRVSDPDLNANVESWWTYALSSGQPLGKGNPDQNLPKDRAHRYVAAAKPLADSPLTLVQWIRVGNEEALGATFALLRPDYSIAWKLELPTDYVKRGNERAQYELLDEIRTEGAILDTSRPGEFVIRHAAANERVAYSVVTDAVRERERRPYAKRAVVASAAKAVVNRLSLKKVSSIRLAQAATGSSRAHIRDIYDFAVSEKGRFAIVRNCDCEQGGGHELVLVDDRGRLLHEVVLPQSMRRTTLRVAWIGEDALVAASEPDGIEAKASAAWVDAKTGKASEIAGFSSPPVVAIAARRAEGFVVLARERFLYTMTDSLIAFDMSGRRRWTVPGSYEKGIFSPVGVTITTKGEVVVLEGIRHQLKVFGWDGKPRASSSLKAAWGREPNYLSAIDADRSGGVVIHDFNGSPPIVRTTASGAIRQGLTPTYPDGRRFDIHGAHVGPDGAMWTSDGHALLKLDSQGKVIHVLGKPPNADTLGEIVALTITRSGTIYAADGRTGAVHVFNSRGELQLIARPEPGDYKGNLFSPSLTVSDAGDIYITRSDIADTGRDFLHYDRSGKRIGIESLALDEVSQAWVSQPGTGNRWVLGYTRAYLVDSKGSVLHRLDRTADGRWLDDPGPAAAAPDGSVAIVSPEKARLRSMPEDYLVTVFSADAKAEATWKIPESGGVAFDGKHVALIIRSSKKNDASRLLITDRTGTTLLSQPLPGAAYGARVAFVDVRGESQLWVFDGKAAIDCFSLEAVRALPN